MLTLLIVGGGLVLLIAFVVGIFNRLVALKNRYQNAFAQIEVQLKRRYDLIPNLVETAKGYMKHEAETLEKVMQARAAALGAKGPAQAGQAEGMLGAAQWLELSTTAKIAVAVQDDALESLTIQGNVAILDQYTLASATIEADADSASFSGTLDLFTSSLAVTVES